MRPRTRFATIDWKHNDPNVKPGDPYKYENVKNPFARLLARWTVVPAPDTLRPSGQQDRVVPQGASRNTEDGSTHVAAVSPSATSDSAFMDQFYPSLQDHEVAGNAGKKRKPRFCCFCRGRADTKKKITGGKASGRRVNE